MISIFKGQALSSETLRTEYASLVKEELEKYDKKLKQELEVKLLKEQNEKEQKENEIIESL